MNDVVDNKVEHHKDSLLTYYNMNSQENRRNSSTSYGLSPRGSISTRHSSVSIQIPSDNGILGSNLLMPPSERPTSSRLSTGSAWDSFRLSVVSFSKVFLVAPCSRHKCCLGCMSLTDAIPVICVVELFTLVFLAMVVVDFWMTDGKTFYTSYFEGYGNTIAIGYAVFLIFSIPILIFTLLAWYRRKKYLYVFHVLWQWTVFEMLLFLTYTIMKWSRQSQGTAKKEILTASAVVIGGASFLGALIEGWWLFVFVDAMFFEQNAVDRRFSSSTQSKKASQGQRNDLDSDGSNSRRNSATIPIVKIDRTQSPDWRNNSFSFDVSAATCVHAQQV